jgi:hypothetical protein
MFTLTAQQCKIAHINFREEKHGDESVTAVDVKVTSDMSNDFLSYLSSTLKGSLYGPPDSSVQGSIIHDNPGYMPRLLYPEMGMIKWSGEMKKAQVCLHGATKKSNLVFDCDVNKLSFITKEGGTVEVAFRLQVVPEGPVLGKLAAMLGVELKVSIAPEGEGLDFGDD